MEFNEKLQELRKQKGLTQEELAEAIYVSRTAVSKWESGRGYPNIDSLKAIARFFSVTIDELLSSGQLLNIAEADGQQKEARSRDLVFGLLDLSIAMFLFLPFFSGNTGAAPLLSLSGIRSYLRAAYFLVIGISAAWGVLILALQGLRRPFWEKYRHGVSLAVNAAGTLLFIISRQPYAAAFMFIYLMIKLIMLVKKR